VKTVKISRGGTEQRKCGTHSVGDVTDHFRRLDEENLRGSHTHTTGGKGGGEITTYQDKSLMGGAPSKACKKKKFQRAENPMQKNISERRWTSEMNLADRQGTHFGSGERAGGLQGTKRGGRGGHGQVLTCGVPTEGR